MKKILLTIISLFSAYLLIRYSEVTKAGVILGIKLSLYSVIPALLPFILLTNVMIKLDLCKYISYILHPVLGRTFNVSLNGCFAIIIGFTCGYPMGAKIINDLYSAGKISYCEAVYLSGFCNNCSLPFLTNYIIGNCLMVHTKMYNINSLLLILLIYLPPVLTGIINRFIIRNRQSVNICDDNYVATNPINNTIKSITVLSMYVIVFSIIISFIKASDLSPWTCSILSGLFEITSGSNNIAENITPWIPKLYLILFACTFGGLSITFQSFSQLKDKNFRISYIIGKIESLIIYTILFFILYTKGLLH